MDLKNMVSFFLFAIFMVCFITKLLLQARKYGTKAFVMGKGNKSKETRRVELLIRFSSFIWGTTWLLESLFENWINKAFGSLLNSLYISSLGLVLISFGLIVFIKAMMDMKNSWRVGIDKETKTELVVNGLYKYSRNPAFVGFDLMFLGLFLTFPNVLTLLIAVINITGFHLLILQEEKHLKTMFGSGYTDYMRRVPRYLGL